MRPTPHPRQLATLAAVKALTAEQAELGHDAAVAEIKSQGDSAAGAVDGHADAHSTDNGSDLYDRVLVDAECTHDASIKHVLKHCNTPEGAAMIQRHLAAPERLASLFLLQVHHTHTLSHYTYIIACWCG